MTGRAKVALLLLVVVAAFVVWALMRPATNGPDPYSAFQLGDDQATVYATAKHAYGDPVESSKPTAEPFCVTWSPPYTKLCFVNGELYSKSR